MIGIEYEVGEMLRKNDKILVAEHFIKRNEQDSREMKKVTRTE